MVIWVVTHDAGHGIYTYMAEIGTACSFCFSQLFYLRYICIGFMGSEALMHECMGRVFTSMDGSGWRVVLAAIPRFWLSFLVIGFFLDGMGGIIDLN